MKFNPSIFREYDIRGIAGKDLTEENMELLGGAYVAYMRGKLKATGHTGVLLRALASGEIDDALSAIASRL